MTLKPTSQGKPTGKTQRSLPGWVPIALWGVAIAMAALAILVIIMRGTVNGPVLAAPQGGAARANTPVPTATAGPVVPLPVLAVNSDAGLSPNQLPHTDIPNRPPLTGQTYTITEGDSVFGLADQFKLKPETVLWANFGVLKDNPDLLSMGQVLNIPPTDGVYYKWKDGDKLEDVANQFKAKVQDILLWPGNNLDLVEPKIKPDTMIMIPGGKREFVRAWVMPTIPRGAAGVTVSLPGACNTGQYGAVGGGSFVWPSSFHSISGNNYWSGHLAIDITALFGTPIVAADSGVVVYAGGDNTGYGSVILIDHGNGFQTLYAHLSAIFVRCGQSVFRGGQIAAAGSTGNSTGPHLHFEIRYLGGFVNPMNYLR